MSMKQRPFCTRSLARLRADAVQDDAAATGPLSHDDPSAQILETWIPGSRSRREPRCRRCRLPRLRVPTSSRLPRSTSGAATSSGRSSDTSRCSRRTPGHPLNRFAAARLYGLRNDVVNYEERIAPCSRRLRYRDVAAAGVACICRSRLRIGALRPVADTAATRAVLRRRAGVLRRAG